MGHLFFVPKRTQTGQCRVDLVACPARSDLSSKFGLYFPRPSVLVGLAAAMPWCTMLQFVTCKNRWPYPLKRVAILTLLGGCLSEPLSASSLDFIMSTWPTAKLQATPDPEEGQIEQGSGFQLRISTAEDAHLLLVLVNSDGKAQLLVPHRAATADGILHGVEMRYPDAAAGEALYADMPIGKGYVYIFATREPLLASAAVAADLSWVPEEQLGKQLLAALNASPDLEVAVRRIALQIAAPAMKQFVSANEFVQFYGVGTRSVVNADRGFAIQFANDSADLTEWGRKQLDAVAEGMTDQRLSEYRFMIEGHTDDVGSDEYNMALSDRRAAAVSRYLSDHGVRQTRLRKIAMGKSAPAVVGTSEKARAQNRRVVIKRLDADK
jgi:outer membrane protein OmpA-like peptidoglycan-associated protein